MDKKVLAIVGAVAALGLVPRGVAAQFTAGARELYVTPLSAAHDGDPVEGQVESGSGEIGRSQGHRGIITKRGLTYLINVPGGLPRSFTIEALFFTDNDSHTPMTITFSEGEFRCGMEGIRVSGAGGDGGDDLGGWQTEPVKCRLQVDGSKVQAFINDTRLANFARLGFGRGSQIEIRLPGGTVDPTLLADFRIATNEVVAAQSGTPPRDSVSSANSQASPASSPPSNSAAGSTQGSSSDCGTSYHAVPNINGSTMAMTFTPACVDNMTLDSLTRPGGVVIGKVALTLHNVTTFNGVPSGIYSMRVWLRNGVMLGFVDDSMGMGRQVTRVEQFIPTTASTANRAFVLCDTGCIAGDVQKGIRFTPRNLMYKTPGQIRVQIRTPNSQTVQVVGATLIDPAIRSYAVDVPNTGGQWVEVTDSSGDISLSIHADYSPALQASSITCVLRGRIANKEICLW